MATAALAYEEPDIVTILVQSSFLLLLNIVNWIFDNAVYCGLVGQVLVGMAWGTPGATWLPLRVQETIAELGYLGLILIVYEGEIHTVVVPEVQFIRVRWSLDQVLHTVVKFVFVRFRCSDRRLYTDCIVFHLIETLQCYSCASICCWRRSLFDVPWDNFHDTGDKRP